MRKLITPIKSFKYKYNFFWNQHLLKRKKFLLSCNALILPHLIKSMGGSRQFLLTRATVDLV